VRTSSPGSFLNVEKKGSNLNSTDESENVPQRDSLPINAVLREAIVKPLTTDAVQEREIGLSAFLSSAKSAPDALVLIEHIVRDLSDDERDFFLSSILLAVSENVTNVPDWTPSFLMLLIMHSDCNPNTQADVIRLLARKFPTRLTEFLPNLVAFPESTNPSVLASLAYALGRCPSVTVGTIGLLDRLAHHSSSRVRRASICALLSQHPSTVYKERLLLDLLNDKDPDVISLAIRSLGKLPNSTRFVERIQQEATHENSKVRSTVINVLQELGHVTPEWLEFLDETVSSENVSLSTRVAAAHALAEAGRSSAKIDVVIGLLLDGDCIEEAADLLSALGLLADPRLVEAIISSCDMSDFDQAWAVVCAVSSTRCPTRQRFLAEATNHPSPIVAQAARNGLRDYDAS
jgi:hypothetical protein